MLTGFVCGITWSYLLASFVVFPVLTHSFFVYPGLTHSFFVVFLGIPTHFVCDVSCSNTLDLFVAFHSHSQFFCGIC